MISVYHLFWIIPFSATIGFLIAALFAAGKD